MTTTPRKHHGRTIRTSTRIKTSPTRAWEAWADPQQIANWFVDRAEGEAKPGAVMTWFFDVFNFRQPVPIVEATPGETFVVGSGDAPGPQGHPYLMEITIAKDEGDTVVRLVNSGFSEDARFDDEYEGVVSGWQMALATMKQWLERFPNSRRRHRIVMEPASFTYEALRPLFSSVEGRRRWLEPTMPADAGALADTGREVLLAWETEDAVVGLKAFRLRPQQMLALDFSTWAESPTDWDATDRSLREALQRLKVLLAPRMVEPQMTQK
jgi:uncharacterized protein YndB with AHSA1/START domain